ncbi:hypothetical protein BC831DRAFT_127941 [Entophlyctis helioformis]|nr:hypothetical protein BC831DRAFT_127941 [Entophlyctis helioformis]
MDDMGSKRAVLGNEQFDFVRDLVANLPDPIEESPAGAEEGDGSTAQDGEDGVAAAGGSGRGRGRGRGRGGAGAGSGRGRGRGRGAAASAAISAAMDAASAASAASARVETDAKGAVPMPMPMHSQPTNPVHQTHSQHSQHPTILMMTGGNGQESPSAYSPHNQLQFQPIVMQAKSEAKHADNNDDEYGDY